MRPNVILRLIMLIGFTAKGGSPALLMRRSKGYADHLGASFPWREATAWGWVNCCFQGWAT